MSDVLEITGEGTGTLTVPILAMAPLDVVTLAMAPLDVVTILDAQADLSVTVDGGTLDIAFSATPSGVEVGALAATLGAVTLSAEGTVEVTGALSATLGAVALEASGTLGAVIAGDLAATLGGVALDASGTVAAAVNPTYNSLTHADPGDGVPDTLTPNYSYAGPDSLTFVGVTSTVPKSSLGADDAAQRAAIDAAVAAGILEAFTFPVSGSDPVDINGLTATSNVAEFIIGYIKENTNGGVSVVGEVGSDGVLLGLDFTPPTFVSAEATGTNTVVVTVSEDLFNTPDAANFGFTINGESATVLGATSSGTTVTLNVAEDMVAADTLAGLFYNPGVLADDDGNTLTSFSGEAITNNAPASPVSWDITAGDTVATINNFPPAPTTPAWNITAGDASATINAFPGGA